MMENFNYREEVLRTAATKTTLEDKLSLGGLGVAGEGGEVADVVKKILHHGRSFESMKDKLIKEMGDVYWYLEYLCYVLDMSAEDIQKENIKKLRERYKTGFNTEDSIAKKDEADKKDPIVVTREIGDDGVKTGDIVMLKHSEAAYLGVQPGETVTVDQVDLPERRCFTFKGCKPDASMSPYPCHTSCWEIVVTEIENAT